MQREEKNDKFMYDRSCTHLNVRVEENRFKDWIKNKNIQGSHYMLQKNKNIQGFYYMLQKIKSGFTFLETLSNSKNKFV